MPKRKLKLFFYVRLSIRLIVKFICSAKATKCYKISTPDLSYVLPVKSTVEILQNFKDFSEYINFTKSDKMGHVLAVPGKAIQKSNLHITSESKKQRQSTAL